MASKTLDFTDQTVHVVGRFFEELAIKLFGGVQNDNDKVGGPDIINPEWRRWIEVKAASNKDCFKLWTKQFLSLQRSSAWRKSLGSPLDSIRLRRGFYCLVWYRNGHWNGRTGNMDRRLSASVLYPEHVHAYLAENLLRICLIDAGAIHSAWKSGALEEKDSLRRRREDDRSVPKMYIKINGSELSLLERSPLDLISAWKLPRNRYSVCSTTVSGMSFKGWKLPDFPVTTISSRRFGLDFSKILPPPLYSEQIC